jgi:hypothetical protein
MQALPFHSIDLGALIFAGFAAGYVMALVGLWAGRLPGFIAIDIADYGRRYLVSDRASAWVFGLAAHLVNSVLLAYAWASLIEPNLHWPRPFEGLAWGIVLAIGLAGGLVAPMTGEGFMGMRSGRGRFAATNLFMHASWGLLLGLIYTPR